MAAANARALLVVTALAAAACFAPRYGDEGPLCSVPDKQCPSGLHCADGVRCYRYGHEPVAPPDMTTTTTCTPTDEICNGLDDDCDGVKDNGCPVDGAAIVVSDPESSSQLYGKHDTSSSQGPCPDGEVITGWDGRVGSATDLVRAVCGKPVVKEDTSVVPFKYSVVVSLKDAASWVGDPHAVADAAPWGDAGRCDGDNQIVTGVRPSVFANAGTFRAVTTTTCTDFRIEGSPNAGFALTTSPIAKTTRADWGPDSGDTTQAAAAYDCKGMMVGIAGEYGPFVVNPGLHVIVVNGVVFSCARPRVPVRPGAPRM